MCVCKCVKDLNMFHQVDKGVAGKHIKMFDIISVFREIQIETTI